MSGLIFMERLVFHNFQIEKIAKTSFKFQIIENHSRNKGKHGGFTRLENVLDIV